MFEVGQFVRIRERTWQVLDDHAAYSGGDHTLHVRGLEGEVRGLERMFIYRPVKDDTDGAQDEEAALELVTPLATPALRWNPGTPPSKW
ncbi:MAG TPA: hypothetical protein VKR42_10395, partial [Ktedonobacteraceae bacterium]|nr:hypothetical protein [Ktedonobacteraceae bacterium]